jgi:hypothetical protein
MVRVRLRLLGCAAMSGRQCPGEAASDAAIAAKAKSTSLADAVLGAWRSMWMRLFAIVLSLKAIRCAGVWFLGASPKLEG